MNVQFCPLMKGFHGQLFPANHLATALIKRKQKERGLSKTNEPFRIKHRHTPTTISAQAHRYTRTKAYQYCIKGRNQTISTPNSTQRHWMRCRTAGQGGRRFRGGRGRGGRVNWVPAQDIDQRRRVVTPSIQLVVNQLSRSVLLSSNLLSPAPPYSGVNAHTDARPAHRAVAIYC